MGTLCTTDVRDVIYGTSKRDAFLIQTSGPTMRRRLRRALSRYNLYADNKIILYVQMYNVHITCIMYIYYNTSIKLCRSRHRFCCMSTTEKTKFFN